MEKAEKNNYEFSMFNSYDLDKILTEIYEYYSQITTKKDDNRIIMFYNKTNFIISDKKLILCVTDNLMKALFTYFKMILCLKYAELRQFLRPDITLEKRNVDKEIYYCKGALIAVELLGIEVTETENYYISYK